MAPTFCVGLLFALGLGFKLGTLTAAASLIGKCVETITW